MDPHTETFLDVLVRGTNCGLFLFVVLLAYSIFYNSGFFYGQSLISLT
jgi:hypothetical protein